MRTLALTLALASSGALLWGLSVLKGERTELLRLHDELSDAATREGEAAQNAREGDRLLERARGLPGGTLDIAVMRDLLIGAERGLDIDRISLDFRPESSLPDGGTGGAITATLSGSFEAVYHYLERVEMLRLPLTALEMSLRPDPAGRLLLTIRYRALWELERWGTRKELAPSDFSRLAGWLSRESRPFAERNPFAAATASGGSLVSPEPDEPEKPENRDTLLASSDPELELPRLVGYVLARPELEADVTRRILAAIRFEGELRLVKAGDVVGPYRIERIEARESILLLDERTGERLKLYLE